MSVTIFPMLSVTVDLPIEKLYKLQKKTPPKNYAQVRNIQSEINE